MTTKTYAYKMVKFRILADGSIQHYCRDRIFTPGTEEPTIENIIPCRSGYHSCPKAEDCLHYHRGPDCCMWYVEVLGKIKQEGDKLCSSSIRLIHTMETNSGRENYGYFNDGGHNKGDFNKGTLNKGDYNTGRENRGYGNIGNYNLGDFNKGDSNMGNGNEGHSNHGSRNKGSNNKGGYNEGSGNLGDSNKGNGYTGSHNGRS